LILDIGLMFIMLNTVKDEKSLFIIISGFICGAFVSSLLILAGQVVERTGAAAELGRVALHEDTNPAILAQSICLGFLTAFYMLFQKGLIKKPLAVCLLVLFFFILIAKTQSRMATACAVGIPVISMIWCSKSQHRRQYIFAAFVLAIITLFAVRWVMHSNFLSAAARERMMGAGLEESGRLMMWRQGFRWFLNRPFHGYGFQNFSLLAEATLGQGGITSAHNNIVACTVELGLMGLSLFAAFFILLYKNIKKIADLKLRWLAFSMLLYSLLMGQTSTTYLQKDFWYALTLVMVLVNIGQQSQDETLLESESWDYQQPPQTMSL
jgi:O-antigen ligase